MHSMSPASCRQDAPRPCANLSHEREIELARRIQAGGLDARNELVEANLGLVRWVILRFYSRLLNVAIDFDDVVQAGGLGLMRAADLFDPDRGFRFSTYAVRSIRSHIGRALMKDRLRIRVPAYRWRKGSAANYMTPVGQLLDDPVGREPAEAHALDEPRRRLDRLLTTLPARDRELIHRYAQDPKGRLSSRAFRRDVIPRAEALIDELRQRAEQEGTGDE